MEKDLAIAERDEKLTSARRDQLLRVVERVVDGERREERVCFEVESGEEHSITVDLCVYRIVNVDGEISGYERLQGTDQRSQQACLLNHRQGYSRPYDVGQSLDDIVA